MEENRKGFFFTDIHMRGHYPFYTKQMFEKENIHIQMEDEDMEILKNTCDFLSFSYYMSKCMAKDDSQYEKGKGNLTTGVKNPYLQESQWGWQIDPMKNTVLLVSHSMEDIAKNVSKILVMNGTAVRRTCCRTAHPQRPAHRTGGRSFCPCQAFCPFPRSAQW